MRTSLAAMAGLLTVALGIVGCGGEAETVSRNPDSTTADLVDAVGERVRKEQSASFGFVMKASGQEAVGEGAGRYGDGNVTAAVTISAGGQRFETRFLDASVFVKVPQQLAKFVQDEKSWVDVRKDKRAAATLAGVVQLAESGNPVRMLQQIEQAGTVQTVDQSEVDGRPATRYAIDIEVGQLKGGLPYGLGRLSSQPGQTYSIKLWVGENGLPVKATTDLTELYSAAGAMTGPAGGPGERKATIVITYESWGRTVTVQAPPADDVGIMPQPGSKPR